MDTLDPKLRQALLDLPGGFNAYKEVATQRFETLEEKINEACYVDLTNGDGKRIKTAKIIPAIYKDLQEIKQATELLVDFNKVHKIFKKYKFYHTMLAAISVFAGISVWDIIVEFIKTTVK